MTIRVIIDTHLGGSVATKQTFSMDSGTQTIVQAQQEDHIVGVTVCDGDTVLSHWVNPIGVTAGAAVSVATD